MSEERKEGEREGGRETGIEGDREGGRGSLLAERIFYYQTDL